jgi:predicted N-acetyltransferase YhbS
MADLVLAEGPILRIILTATHTMWSEGLTPAAYERYYTAQLATQWARQGLRRFALIDGAEVLASAKLYTFDAVLAGDPIRVAGLGAVFTQPVHRGRGVARDLIERLLEKATAAGADLALLFSEIGAGYYARLGFEAILTAVHTLRVTESERHGAPATLVRAGEDRDLDNIAAMGAARAAPFRFHLTRDRAVIHYALAKKRLLAGFGPIGRREVQFFVAEEGASAVAYVVLTVRREEGNGGQTAPIEWTLEECGDRDPSGARVGAILQTLIARDPAEKRVPIKAWLPEGFCPPQLTIVSSQPSADIMMARALSDRVRSALPLRSDEVLFWKSDHF